MIIFIWMDIILYVITNIIFILYHSDMDYFLQPFSVYSVYTLDYHFHGQYFIKYFCNTIVLPSCSLLFKHMRLYVLGPHHLSTSHLFAVLLSLISEHPISPPLIRLTKFFFQELGSDWLSSFLVENVADLQIKSEILCLFD